MFKRLYQWAKTHRRLSLALILFMGLGLLAAIIAPTVCFTQGGCPKHKHIVNPYTHDIPFRLVISFTDNADVQSVLPPLLSKYYTSVRLALSNLQVADFADEDILQTAISLLKKQSNLEFLVRDFKLQAPQLPSTFTNITSRYLQELAILNTTCSYTNQWYLSKISAQNAWRQLVNYTNEVIVAVTDSGAQLDHPNLQGVFWQNPKEIPGNGIDDDNNGFIDDVHGAVFAGKGCSFKYDSINMSNCGHPYDVVGHGTKITGLIAAKRRQICTGISGIAPANVKVMVLKVTDETLNPVNPPYLYSDVVRAVDYGVANGARIFSMSFGDDAKNGLQPLFKSQQDEAASAYKTLFNKYHAYGAVFFAAAGNEYGNLDLWKTNGYTYSPCMVDAPNVVCVGATDSSDSIMYIPFGNTAAGSNYGTATVDIGAPGMNVLTTSLGGSYATVSGTSYSAPIVAAVGALTQMILNSTTQIKDILDGSGDLVAAIPFKSNRRLNASRAVEIARASVRNSSLLMNRLASLEAIEPSLMSRAFNVTYYQVPTTSQELNFEIPSQFPKIDQVAMDATTQKLTNFKYAIGYATVTTAMMRITSPGLYGIRVTLTGIKPTRCKIWFGEIAMSTLNNTTFLEASTSGWYRFQLIAYPESVASTIDLKFSLPSSPSKFQYINNTFFTILTNPPYIADYNPHPLQHLPSIWHAQFNELNTNMSWTPQLWSQFTPSSMRQWSISLPNILYPNPTAVRQAFFPPTYNMSATTTTIIGWARANLQVRLWEKPVSFQISCLYCRLYINDLLIIEISTKNAEPRQTQCITLASYLPHEISIWFTTKLKPKNTIAPLTIRWAPCTNAQTPPSASSTTYASLKPYIATNYFIQANTTCGLISAITCNMYVHEASPGQLYGTRPAFDTHPAYNFLFPRDCPPSANPFPGVCYLKYTPAQDYLGTVKPISPPYYFHRCWTYWNTGFRNGETAIFPGTLPGAIYLAGRVVEQQPPIVSYAPINTWFGNTPNIYQLLVIEGFSRTGMWSARAAFWVFDGSSITDPPLDFKDYLAIDSTRHLFKLPSGLAYP